MINPYDKYAQDKKGTVRYYARGATRVSRRRDYSESSGFVWFLLKSAAISIVGYELFGMLPTLLAHIS